MSGCQRRTLTGKERVNGEPVDERAVKTGFYLSGFAISFHSFGHCRQAPCVWLSQVYAAFGSLKIINVRCLALYLVGYL